MRPSQARPRRPGFGHAGRGPVATVLVQKGELSVGDALIAGTAYCRIRAMQDENGTAVETASLSKPVVILGWSHVPSAGDDFRAATLPRYPSIVRDISMLVDEALPAGAVRGTIRSGAPTTLVSIAEFDRYQGKGVPDGQVSLSVRLTFRAADRTLTDEDAQAATEHIVSALKAAHGAERR